ncbi:hypothetical protein Taro_034574 [Colocasia esculenta]|uniref:Helitron helicase-like domain-containing protein n=1 Tax=Colocasia esculenta TaxID=4460 RepID=A0A843WAG5_COLES|nr:hypothetical protein [Colocasia esculenta]
MAADGDRERSGETEDVVRSVMSCEKTTQARDSGTSLTPLDDKIITIRKDCGLYQRIYNAPTDDQVVAILIEGNNMETRYMTDIVVDGHDGTTHKVQSYFGCYDQLQYPLLFPRGESGWHRGIKRNKRGMHFRTPSSLSSSDHTDFQDILHMEEGNKSCYISVREYYAYLLQIRETSNNTLLFGGRLLQQYVVDMYIKIETNRLDFYYNNQNQIRAELYQGIVDAVRSRRSCVVDDKTIVVDLGLTARACR